MQFSSPLASVLVPDGSSGFEAAASRVTHLGIGAHQDDLEFMALHGILACLDDPALSFGGVICTSGSGSVRTGPFAGKSDDEIVALRRAEQEEAARLGKYGIMIQLGHEGSVVKTPGDATLAADLAVLFAHMRPRVVYTHNPADKHEAHVAVTAAVVKALRGLPAERRPEKVYGCEMWRDLDWLGNEDKVLLDVGGRPELARELTAVFRSQIAGGKRYDLAIEGRRLANATFLDPRSADQAEQLTLAMDLTPLIQDHAPDAVEYVTAAVDRFRADVQRIMRGYFG
jgi:LmbE family N-acetylglucosaminyl deacetylase